MNGEVSIDVGTDWDNSSVSVHILEINVHFKLSPNKALFLAQLLVEKSLNLMKEDPNDKPVY